MKFVTSKDYIGVFDSGVGGISVLRHLRQMMPGERYLYFGDTANAPYGCRPTEEVRRLTMDAIEQWAADEFRSTNGQLQWIIAEALRRSGRRPRAKRKTSNVTTNETKD